MNPSGRTEDLKIELQSSDNGTPVMALAGQLTLKTLFDFQNAIRQEATKSLILDIGNVEYMDSAGLGSVIGAFSSCQRSGRGFAIVGVSGRIRVLFQVTRVDGLLPCFDSLAAAETAVAATKA